MTLQRIVLGILYAIHWIHEHAPEILACWGALTWTLSMLVKRLDMNPRVHAFFQTLIAMGFDGPAETIALTHTARDRTAFARGALTAAGWLKGRSGWFTMRDVLGI